MCIPGHFWPKEPFVLNLGLINCCLGGLSQKDKWPMLVVNVRSCHSFKLAKQLVPGLYQLRIVWFIFCIYIAMYRPCLRGLVHMHVWMLCVPWGLFGVYICVALAAESARFVPFKLFKMRKELGISPMSFALKFHQQEWCISVTSDTSKWPREVRLREPGALTSDYTAAKKWATKLQEVRVPLGAPLLVCSAEVTDKPRGRTFLNDKSCPSNCLKQNFWCFGQVKLLLVLLQMIERVQWIPGGQYNWLEALSLALTNNPCFRGRVDCLMMSWHIGVLCEGRGSPFPSSQTASSLDLGLLYRCRRNLWTEESLVCYPY